MPHFDKYGGDEWICQRCARIFDSRTESEWRPDITGHQSAGNVCPSCLKTWEASHSPSVQLPVQIMPPRSNQRFAVGEEVRFETFKYKTEVKGRVTKLSEDGNWMEVTPFNSKTPFPVTVNPTAWDYVEVERI